MSFATATLKHVVAEPQQCRQKNLRCPSTDTRCISRATSTNSHNFSDIFFKSFNTSFKIEHMNAPFGRHEFTELTRGGFRLREAFGAIASEQMKRDDGIATRASERARGHDT